MRNVIRAKKVRVVRPAWWAASAVAAVAVGLVAGPAYAAPPNHADKASHAPGEAGLNEPLLRHGALTVRGTEASDEITLRLQAGEPGILEVDFGDDGSADFSFERAKIASIEVKARAGDDHVRIDESNGVFTDSIPTTLAGEAGNDDLAGGSGAETMLGGPGNDSLDGNRGNDLAVMGAGDDTFVWDPGDGSDTIEGQAGADTMLFNGANVPENVSLTANGNRLTFFRDAGTITMDTERRRAGRLQRARRRRHRHRQRPHRNPRRRRQRRPRRHPGRGHGRRPARPHHRQRAPIAETRSTSPETSPVSPCPACRLWWRFSIRSQPTRLQSTVSAATT